MKTAAILFLSFIPWLSAQPARKTDLEHDLLKGYVKTIVVHFARLSNVAGKLQEGELAFQTAATYNEKGLLAEKVFMEDRLKVQQRYTHDPKGNRSITEIGRDKTRVLNWQCKYDSAGNRVQDVISDFATMESRTTYKYDPKGNRTEETINARHRREWRKVYRHNDKGDVIESATYLAGKLVTTEIYTYEFDAAGNWIKRITSVRQRNATQPVYEPMYVFYRTITY